MNELGNQLVAMEDEQQEQEQEAQIVMESTENNGRIVSTNDHKKGRNYGTHHPLSQAAGSWSFPAFLGKHRMQAAINNLNNQINIIQEELEELETMGESSTVCQNVISSVESIPDPLLPLTKGPVDAGWDRWFGGASNNPRSHKRWI